MYLFIFDDYARLKIDISILFTGLSIYLKYMIHYYNNWVNKSFIGGARCKLPLYTWCVFWLSHFPVLCPPFLFPCLHSTTPKPDKCFKKKKKSFWRILNKLESEREMDITHITNKAQMLVVEFEARVLSTTDNL